MARGSTQATSAATTAANNSNAFGGNASSLYSTLTPQLTNEAANPQGFNPADEAGMQTEAQQTAGGTQSAAVGEGGLQAARTRNAGAPAAAIADASRGAGEQLSKNSLGISNANARLKEGQRQSALTGLQGLTGLETGAQNTALGQVAPDVNANTNAANESWDWAKDLLDPALQASGQAAAGYFKAAQQQP